MTVMFAAGRGGCGKCGKAVALVGPVDVFKRRYEGAPL